MALLLRHPKWGYAIMRPSSEGPCPVCGCEVGGCFQTADKKFWACDIIELEKACGEEVI